MSDIFPFGIIADDLTGACDCGGQFSHLGAEVTAFFFMGESMVVPPAPRNAVSRGSILVWDGESRHCSPEEARKRTENGAAMLENFGWPIRYKKIDSTLRGNLIAELQPFYAGGKTLLVAPAFPAMGRTVEGGEVRIHEVPVHQTSLGKDALNPVRTSHLPTLLRTLGAVDEIPLNVLERGGSAVSEQIASSREKGVRLIVSDTVTEKHLEVLTEVLLEDWAGFLAVGSAGWARVLARMVLPSREDWAPSSPMGTSRKERLPVLTMAGSVNQVTRRQLEIAMGEPGSMAYTIDPRDYDAGMSESRERLLLARAMDSLSPALHGSARHVIISIACVKEDTADFMEEIERREARANRLNRMLGSLGSHIIREFPLSGLILTGGDTARAVLGALGVNKLRLGPEILPGIPLGWSIGGPSTVPPVLTKAGGFGDENALATLAGLLRNRIAENSRNERTTNL